MDREDKTWPELCPHASSGLPMVPVFRMEASFHSESLFTK